MTQRPAKHNSVELIGRAEASQSWKATASFSWCSHGAQGNASSSGQPELHGEALPAALTLPSVSLISLDNDRGGLLVLDMNSLFSTTLLKPLSVLLTRKA